MVSQTNSLLQQKQITEKKDYTIELIYKCVIAKLSTPTRFNQPLQQA